MPNAQAQHRRSLCKWSYRYASFTRFRLLSIPHRSWRVSISLNEPTTDWGPARPDITLYAPLGDSGLRRGRHPDRRFFFLTAQLAVFRLQVHVITLALAIHGSHLRATCPPTWPPPPTAASSFSGPIAWIIVARSSSTTPGGEGGQFGDPQLRVDYRPAPAVLLIDTSRQHRRAPVRRGRCCC